MVKSSSSRVRSRYNLDVKSFASVVWLSGVRFQICSILHTGANTGIGKVTALDMSKRGAKVIILCRNQDKAKEAANEISDETGGVVAYEKLDLASLASVQECAKNLLDSEEKIDILINNAGVMNCPNWKTEDGFDMQLGTNHLGHFLLTELLMPLLKESVASGFRPRF